jgi:hypothetical protein
VNILATINFTISNIDLEEFSAKRTILKMSLGIILVFDLGKPETFQHLKERMPEITQNAGYIPIILLGTNKEAEHDSGVQIASMDIDHFMFKYGISHYLRVSTKTGEGIQRTFETISDEIIKEIIRKLGSEEVKSKKQFSIAIALIGDKSIRKDWISEYGVHRFAAPSHLGGAVSHKIMDRDIHHLIPEQPIEKSPVKYTEREPLQQPTPQPPRVGGSREPQSLREAQLEELKTLKDLKRDLIDQIAEKELEKEPTKEEVVLKKPEPLKPMDFEKSEEKPELSSELKRSIEAEVNELRGIIRSETPKKIDEEEGLITKMPPPPGGAPSSTPASPPATVPAPKPAIIPPPPPKEEPTPPPTPTPKAASLDDTASVKKKKEKARRMRAESGAGLAMRSKRVMAPELDEATPIDEDGTVDEESLKEAFGKQALKTTDVRTSTTEGIHLEEAADEIELEEFTWGGAEKAPKEMEITTEKLLRKTTVFYRERMNPETLNKLAVVLSTEKIYEKLKIKIEEVARAATDKTLEIDKDVPIVEVIPEFPGCVCVPSIQRINAEKEYDVASFLITPLQTGEIPDAKVRLYHKGKLIETISTPTKVVKTTAAKITAGAAVVVPLLSQFPLLSTPIDNFFSGILSEALYTSLGNLDGIVLILTGLIAIVSGIFYLFKRPKDAKPVETFPELDEKLTRKQ